LFPYFGIKRLSSFPFDIERIALNQKQAIRVPRNCVFWASFYMQYVSGGVQLSAQGQAKQVMRN
jgi:hypothetical protein